MVPSLVNMFGDRNNLAAATLGAVLLPFTVLVYVSSSSTTCMHSCYCLHGSCMRC